MPPSPNWNGAWPEQLLVEFLGLTSESAIKQAEAWPQIVPLAEVVNPERYREKRIADLVVRVHAHSGYHRLQALPGFPLIMEERQRRSRGNALFGGPLGEIRLLYVIGLVIGAHNPKFRPKRATLTHQRRVYAAVVKLQGLMMPGAEPTDIFEMSDLRRLLKTFVDGLRHRIETADKLGTRPTRADSDAAARYWLGGLCRNLYETFGEVPQLMVSMVAGWIGYSPDESTIARYVRSATHRATRS
jgi:hypothetical protein